MTIELAGSSPPQARARSVALMVLSVFLLTLMDAAVKELTRRYPVPVIMVFRCFLAVPVLMLALPRDGGLTSLLRVRPGLQLLRGAFGFMTALCYFEALADLPLADTLAVSFSAPMFVALLSRPLLGETVSRRSWAVIVIGFIGVLVVVRPGLGGLGPGAAYASAAALFYALHGLTLRRLGHSDGATATTIYGSLVIGLVTLPAAAARLGRPGAGRPPVAGRRRPSRRHRRARHVGRLPPCAGRRPGAARLHGHGLGGHSGRPGVRRHSRAADRRRLGDHHPERALADPRPSRLNVTPAPVALVFPKGPREASAASLPPRSPGPAQTSMAATIPIALPPPRYGAAIALTLAAFALFTGMDSCVKLLSGRYPTAQIACLNALFALLPMLCAAGWGGGLHRLRTRRLPLQGLRGLCQASGVPLTFFAYSLMPLADAYALLFTMPLIITALSVPVLGEPVGPRRWAAVLVGFLGVLIVLRPGSGLIGLGTIAALGGAFLNACGMMILRRLGSTDNPEAAAFYGNLTIVLVMALALPFVLTEPAPVDLVLSALGGVLGGTAYLLLAHAYKRAPAALVAPFQYAQMPFALIAGLLLFGNRPEPMMLVGASVVIGSGLYILHRETLRRAPAASSGPLPPTPVRAAPASEAP